MMNRIKQNEETYTKYYYEKIAPLNRCKSYGPDAVSCIIGGINDNVVMTGAKARNHTTPESLYVYLSNLTSGTEKSKLHEHSSKFYSRNKYRRFNNKSLSRVGKSVTCYKCKKDGHTADLCDEKTKSKSVPSSSEKRCAFCRRSGQLEERCFLKKKLLVSKESI